MTARLSVEEWRQLDLLKGPRQKGTLPRTALEFQMQVVLADMLRGFANPDWFWTAFPADGLRTKATGARLKRAGLRPGVSDFIFISPTGLFYGLELKRKKGRLSDSQEAFADWCYRHGVAYAVADTVDTAVRILVAWGVLETGWAS